VIELAADDQRAERHDDARDAGGAHQQLARNAVTLSAPLGARPAAISMPAAASAKISA
jgi:hypothetical protein